MRRERPSNPPILDHGLGDEPPFLVGADPDVLLDHVIPVPTHASAFIKDVRSILSDDRIVQNLAPDFRRQHHVKFVPCFGVPRNIQMYLLNL